MSCQQNSLEHIKHDSMAFIAMPGKEAVYKYYAKQIGDKSIIIIGKWFDYYCFDYIS